MPCLNPFRITRNDYSVISSNKKRWHRQVEGVSKQHATGWLFSHVGDPFLDDSLPREYVLYLRPTGPLAQKLSEFWQQSKQICGKNKAHNIFPHITLCQFFMCEDSKVDALTEALQATVMRWKCKFPAPLPLELYTSSNFIGLFVKEESAEVLKKFAADFAAEAASKAGRSPSFVMKPQLVLERSYSILNTTSSPSFHAFADGALERRQQEDQGPGDAGPLTIICQNVQPLRMSSQGPQKRCLFVCRHGERMDVVFGKYWLSQCFDAKGRYVRSNLNMPPSLPQRSGGFRDYEKDAPITVLGCTQARLVGEALLETNTIVDYIYSSPSLRCVQTAHNILKGAPFQLKFRSKPGGVPYNPVHLIYGQSWEICQPRSASHELSHESHKSHASCESRKSCTSCELSCKSRASHESHVPQEPCNTRAVPTAPAMHRESHASHESRESHESHASHESCKSRESCAGCASHESHESSASYESRKSHKSHESHESCKSRASQKRAGVPGMQQENNLKIRIEPGLFEWTKWVSGSSLPAWIPPVDLAAATLSVDTTYRPHIPGSKLVVSESYDSYISRSYQVTKEIISECKGKGNNILIVAHASSLEACTCQLQGLSPQNSKDFVQMVRKIPYLGFCSCEELGDTGVWQLTDPPILPLTHGPTGGFNWRETLLQE
ncbi:hypothetical protein TURU_052009 [Turdus rufiventris]|nr:hypothetical protein TURU_052009 [Turdus rufiventris]